MIAGKVGGGAPISAARGEIVAEQLRTSRKILVFLYITHNNISQDIYCYPIRLLNVTKLFVFKIPSLYLFTL